MLNILPMNKSFIVDFNLVVFCINSSLVVAAANPWTFLKSTGPKRNTLTRWK